MGVPQLVGYPKWLDKSGSGSPRGISAPYHWGSSSPVSHLLDHTPCSMVLWNSWEHESEVLLSSWLRDWGLKDAVPWSVHRLAVSAFYSLEALEKIQMGTKISNPWGFQGWTLPCFVSHTDWFFLLSVTYWLVHVPQNTIDKTWWLESELEVALLEFQRAPSS